MKITYILKGHFPVYEPNLEIWGEWMEHAERCIAMDSIGPAKVSTVFLGLDHALPGDDPLLFETMVFGGQMDGFTRRYSTWDEAEAGHSEIVILVAEVVVLIAEDQGDTR